MRQGSHINLGYFPLLFEPWTANYLWTIWRSAVAMGEQHIGRQRELVSKIERDGRDSTEARQLLATSEELQDLHIADRDRLEKELADTPEGPGQKGPRVRGVGARGRPGVQPLWRGSLEAGSSNTIWLQPAVQI